jgi:hypothetical protein
MIFKSSTVRLPPNVLASVLFSIPPFSCFVGFTNFLPRKQVFVRKRGFDGLPWHNGRLKS